MNVISITDVTKSFHGRALYSKASATFPERRVTALVGPNGSGKSVLFRMICGFLQPDSGEVWIDPRFLPKGRDYPAQFGIIIDRPGFVPHLTGYGNLELLARIRKVISRGEIEASLRRFGLDPELRQQVKHYSLGMRQKLALAQAFMESPEVVLLDEPFNALDEDSVSVVRAVIRDFQAAGGTVVFTSHNPEDVAALADGVIRLNEGKLVQEPV